MNTNGRITAIFLFGLGLVLAVMSAHPGDIAPAGSWTKKSYRVEGNWSVVTMSEGMFPESWMKTSGPASLRSPESDRLPACKLRVAKK